VVNAQAQAGLAFPQPTHLPAFDVGALRVTPAASGMLLFTPLLVAALAIFLKKSRHGIAVRASAANPDTARLSGMSPGRMSMVTWATAGALSACTASLVRPNLGFVNAETLGPGLLLRALAAAVIARMQSLPIALFAGIALGIVEEVLLWNYPESG